MKCWCVLLLSLILPIATNAEGDHEMAQGPFDVGKYVVTKDGKVEPDSLKFHAVMTPFLIGTNFAILDLPNEDIETLGRLQASHLKFLHDLGQKTVSQYKEICQKFASGVGDESIDTRAIVEELYRLNDEMDDILDDYYTKGLEPLSETAYTWVFERLENVIYPSTRSTVVDYRRLEREHPEQFARMIAAIGCSPDVNSLPESPKKSIKTGPYFLYQ